MTPSTSLKATLIWLVIAVLAIANGTLREFVLAPVIGHAWALPLSGISLSLIVLLVTHLAFSFLGAHTPAARWLVGVQWVLMTLLLEFGFGHYVAGKSWAELLRSLNVLTGDLFLLVLLVSLLAPSLVARMKNGR